MRDWRALDSGPEAAGARRSTDGRSPARRGPPALDSGPEAARREALDSGDEACQRSTANRWRPGARRSTDGRSTAATRAASARHAGRRCETGGRSTAARQRSTRGPEALDSEALDNGPEAGRRALDSGDEGRPRSTVDHNRQTALLIFWRILKAIQQSSRKLQMSIGAFRA